MRPALLSFVRAGHQRPPCFFFCSGEPMTSLNSETAKTDSDKDSKSEAMRILVIEDDEATAAYMVKGLTENGYVVDRVASGRDGLFHATSGQFDLIIVDRMLPETRRAGRGQGAAGRQGRHPGPVPERAGPGRRPGQRASGRRRRLSDQALRLLRTAGADRGPAAPAQRARGADEARGRRSRDGPAGPPGEAGRRRGSTSSPANSACWNISCAMPDRS